MSARFLPDGRLKTEQAETLDGGADLTSEDATLAVKGTSRVLLHSYPHTEDITADQRRIGELLRRVSLHPELEGYSASVYKNANERVLLIEHRH